MTESRIFRTNVLVSLHGRDEAQVLQAGLEMATLRLQDIARREGLEMDGGSIVMERQRNTKHAAAARHAIMLYSGFAYPPGQVPPPDATPLQP